jgi:hypothetical protein
MAHVSPLPAMAPKHAESLKVAKPLVTLCTANPELLLA